MPVEDIMVHTGTPYRMEEVGARIEGSRDVEPVRLTPFGCCLFLPLGSESQGGQRSRQVSVPTLLYTPFDVSGQPVELGPDDELFVLAAELAPQTGAPEVRWQVDGAPQPAGRPGEDPVVIQARLQKVED